MSFRAVNGGGMPDPLAVGLGFVNWNGQPEWFQSLTQSLVSGTIYAIPIWLPAGKPVSSAWWSINTGGAGTKPTHIYCGYCSKTTMKAQSGDLASSSIWTAAGLVQAPLSAAWTPSVSDIYYQLLLVVGTWGTTQMLLNRSPGAPTAQVPGLLTWLYGSIGTGQSAMPTNAAAVTFSTTGFQSWVAAS